MAQALRTAEYISNDKIDILDHTGVSASCRNLDHGMVTGSWI